MLKLERSSDGERTTICLPGDEGRSSRVFDIERKRKTNVNTTNETTYVLGHSRPEIQRLKTQAAILRPTTERLLRSAGIGPGMRVLDLGCGAGDVAMLAAELVGPSGSVVGIDRSLQVLEVAAERAQTAGLRQIVFEHMSAEDFLDDDLFDLVVGRYILIHQSDPVAMLRAAARLVRPGAAIAFHELRLRDQCHSLPNVPLWEMIDKLIRMAFSSALPHYDAGDRLIQHFWDASLPQPDLFCETYVWGGSDAPHYAWMVDTLRSLLPQLERIGIVMAHSIGIETLEVRLREAVVAARSQVSGPAQICAWART
jgi:ubiquinone/menaquinone biosynthesis C-methylase UbiE